MFFAAQQSLKQFSLDDWIDPLSYEFQSMLQLAENPAASPADTYKRHIQGIREMIPRVNDRLAAESGASFLGTGFSEREQRILKT